MVGKQLAHFEITDTLGEGGMGVVYGAFDRRLERRVAVKILPPGKVADSARKLRFIQEARAASALNHPNIVTIYDIGEADGVNYIAMELVPGQTLEDVLARRRLKLPEALKYAAQLAGALAAAHAAGLVHRDLKPANIMITEAGVAKVLDFGLAKLTERAGSDEEDTRSKQAITEEGAVVGTAAYMSPEQAEGRTLDTRSDIFSFGLVLYEMLSGKRAFSAATNMATMAAILEKEPVPIGQLVPGLPKELERIVARCLRKDLARRSQSIAEIELALQELKEESESGASAGKPASRRTPARRWQWVAVAGALVLSVALFVLYRQSRAADLPPSELPLTSFPGYQGQASLSPDGSQFAFVWDGGVTGDQQLYVSLVGRGAPLRLTNTAGTGVFAPAWSPDGLTIAFIRSRAGTNTGELALISPLGGPERKIADVSGGRVAWSPDGKWLYFADRVAPQTTALFVMSSDGGERRRLIEPRAGSFGDGWPSVSPDSRHLAFVRSSADFNSDVFVADLTDALTAGAVRRLTFDHRTMASPVWTTDGRDIIYVSGEAFGLLGIYRVHATGGSPTKLALSGGDYATSLSIASKGHRLAYGRSRQDYNMYQRELPPNDGPAGPPIKFLSGSRLEQSPTYSPTDGRRILFSSNRTGVHQMFVADVDGSNLVQLTTIPGWAAGSPKWSPDGTTIVFDARPNGLSDIFTVSATGGPPTQLTNHPAEDHVPCYSSDGRWIYFASTRVGLSQLFRMPAHGGDAVQLTRKGALACQASPDGKWIYYSRFGGGLWKMPADGGEEIAVLDPRAMPNSWTFAVTSSRIYYAGPRDRVSGTMPLNAYRLTDGKRVELGSFDKPLRIQFSVSPDGRWLAWTQLDSQVNDMMLVENFR